MRSLPTDARQLRRAVADRGRVRAHVDEHHSLLNLADVAKASGQGNALQRALDFVKCLRMWREQALERW
jgi:hypothetical protein